MRTPSQDMSFWYEIWTFRMNDQVRVVTRSLPRLEVVRGLSASPRLSQDTGIIANRAAGRVKKEEMEINSAGPRRPRPKG